MKVKVQLLSDGRIILPFGYNTLFQGLIYSHLDREESIWLHERGYKIDKRSFRLFTFSNILQKPVSIDKKGKRFSFPPQIDFYISSPVEWILEQLAHNIIMSETVPVGVNHCRVSSVEIMNQPDIASSPVTVKALTPIEVHSSFSTAGGSQKTYYYTPYENEFKALINDNLKKKWKAFNDSDCPHEIGMKPLFNGNNNEKIVLLNHGGSRFVVKGWVGKYALTGDPAMLRFALDVGLGSRNSNGFGMVEVLR